MSPTEGAFVPPMQSRVATLFTPRQRCEQSTQLEVTFTPLQINGAAVAVPIGKVSPGIRGAV